MAYRPIRTPADLQTQLLIGVTREDHWLDLKREAYQLSPQDRVECARDIAQFANASGGVLILGAAENDHVLSGFTGVQHENELIRWMDDVVKGHLTPVPPVEFLALGTSTGQYVVAANVPPVPRVVARRAGDSYEFPVRAGDSRRYMTLIEIEARMQQHERLMRLRLEQISGEARVTLDADVRGTQNLDWRIGAVDDDTVTLAKGALRVAVPLAYVAAVHRANEPDSDWVVGLSCIVQLVPGPPHHLRVRKFRP